LQVNMIRQRYLNHFGVEIMKVIVDCGYYIPVASCMKVHAPQLFSLLTDGCSRMTPHLSKFAYRFVSEGDGSMVAHCNIPIVLAVLLFAHRWHSDTLRKRRLMMVSMIGGGKLLIDGYQHMSRTITDALGLPQDKPGAILDQKWEEMPWWFSINVPKSEKDPVGKDVKHDKLLLQELIYYFTLGGNRSITKEEIPLYPRAKALWEFLETRINEGDLSDLVVNKIIANRYVGWKTPEATPVAAVKVANTLSDVTVDGKISKSDGNKFKAIIDDDEAFQQKLYENALKYCCQGEQYLWLSAAKKFAQLKSNPMNFDTNLVFNTTASKRTKDLDPKWNTLGEMVPTVVKEGAMQRHALYEEAIQEAYQTYQSEYTADSMALLLERAVGRPELKANQKLQASLSSTGGNSSAPPGAPAPGGQEGSADAEPPISAEAYKKLQGDLADLQAKYSKLDKKKSKSKNKTKDEGGGEVERLKKELQVSLVYGDWCTPGRRKKLIH